MGHPVLSARPPFHSRHTPLGWPALPTSICHLDALPWPHLSASGRGRRWPSHLLAGPPRGPAFSGPGPGVQPGIVASLEHWAEGSPASPGLPPGRPKPGPPGPGPEDPSALPHRAPCPPASQQPLRRALLPLHHRPELDPQGELRARAQTPRFALLASAVLGGARGAPGPPSPTHDTRVACTSPRRHPPNPPTAHTHPPHSRHPTAPHVHTHNGSSVPQPRGIAPTRHRPESHPPKGLWVRRRVAAQGNGSAQLHLPQMIARAGWGWGSGQAWPGSRLPPATPAGRCLAAALDQGENAGGAESASVRLCLAPPVSAAAAAPKRSRRVCSLLSGPPGRLLLQRSMMLTRLALALALALVLTPARPWPWPRRDPGPGPGPGLARLQFWPWL